MTFDDGLSIFSLADAGTGAAMVWYYLTESCVGEESKDARPALLVYDAAGSLESDDDVVGGMLPL